MRQLGIAPEQVSQVVMTHLHSDYLGGMSAFGGKRILVSEAAAKGHAGALICRIPHDVQVTPLAYRSGAAGVFPNSAALTGGGTISVIPTPGHANGHQSVLDPGRMNERVYCRRCCVLAGSDREWGDSRDRRKIW